MKITLIGGGAHRLLPILRGTLAIPGALDGGEICLHDLDVVRAETMGRMLLKTPEQRRAACRVTWGLSLEAALEGSDAVGVIMPASRPHSQARSHRASLRHGFIASDNVSPNGALCAVKIAPVILGIARAMEVHCPRAWLVNFVNPVAVLSGLVNNHTRIRAMGVCQGFTNHLSDLPRLFGRDEESSALAGVETAGINHLSFITRGTWAGEDLFAALRTRLGPDWRMCDLQPWWNDAARANIIHNVGRLVRFWRELGVLVFSTEPDGMDHLAYEESVRWQLAAQPDQSDAGIDARLARQAAGRAEADASFRRHLDEDLGPRFWDEHWKTDPRFRRDDQDVFVRIFAALSGARTSTVAVSVPNRGAIAGIKDRHVVEYTQVLSREGLRPASARYEIPDVVHGLIAGLASHQTLLGDALAAEDPRALAHALLSYPVKPYGESSRALYRELLAVNADELAPWQLRAAEFLQAGGRA